MTDMMAQRYCTLPSKIVKEATLGDLVTFEVARIWEQWHNTAKEDRVALFDEDALSDMIDKARLEAGALDA